MSKSSTNTNNKVTIEFSSPNTEMPSLKEKEEKEAGTTTVEGRVLELYGDTDAILSGAQKTQLEIEIARLKEEMGVMDDAQHLRIYKVDYARLSQEGVLVQLHIERWRGTVSLNPEDLGLSGLRPNEQLRLGSKLLLPAATIKKLNALEGKGRSALVSRSFQMPFGYFVLATDYKELREKLEEIKQEYFDEAATIINQYQDVQDTVATEYDIIAREAYGRFRRLDPAKIVKTSLRDKDGAINDGVDVFDPENWKTEKEYADEIVKEIRKMFPSQQDVEASFRFEWRLSYIPLQHLLAQQEEAANLIRVRADSERQRIALENQVADQKAQEEVRRERAKTQAVESAADARQRMLMEMHRDEMRSRRAMLQEQTEQIVGSIIDMENQFVACIYDACMSALATIKNNKKLTGKNASQISQMIKRVKDWNQLIESEDAETIITALDEALKKETIDGKKDTAYLEAELRKVAILTQYELEAMGGKNYVRSSIIEGKDGSLIDLEVVSTPANVRRARQSLKLPDVEVPEIESKGRRGKRTF